MATEIVIASAARTPIGSFNGAFGAVPAHDLGKVAIKGALERAKVKPEEVDEVIMGQILSAAQGQNPARQAAVNSGIPVEKTALGINQLCGSGLRAVAFGWQAIRNGDASIMVVGGQESMSQAPHAGYMRDGTKMGEFKMIDTMLKDGLWDAFHGYHMGNTAENVAQKFQITRAEQDAFAASSQNKAEAAQKSGRFKDEIVPVTVKTRKGEVVVDTDEFPRHGTTVETLGKLRPAFAKEGGSVTAGNASGINDGAAALVLMTADEAKKRGIKPLGQDRVVGDHGRRSLDHGHRPGDGLAGGAEEGRLDGEGSRPGRGQRGVRRASRRGRQAARPRSRQAQRQWRRDRARPSDRRLGRARADDAALRDAEARRQEGPCHALHRRRHGHRHVRPARLARPQTLPDARILRAHVMRRAGRARSGRHESSQ